MHKDQLKQSSLIKIFPLPLDTISTHPSLHSSTAVSSSLAQTITAQQAFLLTSLFLECSSSTSGPSPPAFLNYKKHKDIAADTTHLFHPSKNSLSNSPSKALKPCRQAWLGWQKDIYRNSLLLWTLCRLELKRASEWFKTHISFGSGLLFSY